MSLLVAHTPTSNASIHAIAGLSEESLGRWRDLAATATDPNPFFEPEFLMPAAELVPSAPDRLVVVERDGKWLGALPIGDRRLRAVTKASEAGVSQYGFLSTPLLAPGDTRATVACLLEGVAEATGSRSLLMQRLAASGPFFEALSELSDDGTVMIVEREDYERALLTRVDGDWHAHLGSHHLREQRRMRRRLNEQLGGEVTVRDRAGDEAAVERFLEIELAGWKGTAGTAFASHRSEAEFFRRVCRGFHEAGRLQLLDLGLGERSIALKCNLLARPGSFAFKIAFDETYAKLSPGLQLEHENTELFQGSDLTWMDSCAQPDNQMINRLWTGRRALSTVVLGNPRLRGRARAFSLAVTRRLRGAPAKMAALHLPLG